ncbi:hypothetical protein BDK61_4145 [Haloarcula quadrata]|uniref:Uncharacterized protein n=1 Tax=Haloarcula quadrata TaxID=182779 RepID=A0A495QWJ6_9EURY|nr:hypothetical protein [Haloarcula quadrata]RKS78480.1 hypothetical protein BDK61_4145 [Haloarcula quadrata]
MRSDEDDDCSTWRRQREIDERRQSFSLASNKVPEKSVAEDKNENCADEIGDEIEQCVSLSVGDEYWFETDSARRSVNNVLHEFPEDAHGNDTGNDPLLRVYAQPPREYVNKPTKNRRRVNMGQIVLPPDIVVRAEHPDSVCQHRCLYVNPLPRPKFNGTPPFQDVWQIRSPESDESIHNRPRAPPPDSLGEGYSDTRADRTPE